MNLSQAQHDFLRKTIAQAHGHEITAILYFPVREFSSSKLGCFGRRHDQGRRVKDPPLLLIPRHHSHRPTGHSRHVGQIGVKRS